jgi:SAM-dependent methyltransferase
MYQEKEKIIRDELPKNNIKIDGNSIVLEIGCGTGYWIELLRSFGVKNYTGNDIADVSISTLKQKFPEYNFLLGDISEIPLPGNAFDLAMMIDVTQHITDDRKFNKGLNNVWQSLKPDSYFLVTMWDPGKNVYLANKLRLNRIEKPRGIDWYKKIIRDEGFIISNVEFNDKYLLIIKKR